MGLLETVIIRYKNKDRIEFQNYAEFLRLTGIYVWEFSEEYHTGTEQSTDVADALELDLTKLLQQLDEKGQEHAWANLYNLLYEYLTDEQHDSSANILTNELTETFQKINSIYTNRKLLRAATTLQYFRLNSQEVQDAAKAFTGAAQDLEKISSDNEALGQNRHFRYAILYCKQKANLGRWLRKQPLLVLADVLADECLKLANDFPDFSNAMVLRGLAYEMSERNSRDAVESFNEAAKKVGRYPFASSIYYWIGKRCEVYRASNMVYLTKNAYSIGYRLEPKYRLCYKMAFVSERGSRWQEADKYYRECMDYISRKGDYLDPLEQEYSYKSAIRAAYNCLAHLEDVNGAVRLLLGAEKLRENIKSGKDESNQYTRYYFNLYGSDAPSYVKLELSRMGTIQLYQYLAKVYQILNNQQEAVKYQILFETEREKVEERRRLQALA